MWTHRLSTLALASVVVWLLVELIMIWPALPDRIATHFDWWGRPNGWSSRAELAVLIAVLIVVFLGLFAAARLLQSLPTRLINMPNKNYWLAPERRAETIGTLCSWAQCLLVLVMASVAVLIVAALRASLMPEPRLGLDALIWFGILFTLVIVMNGWLFWRFRRPEDF